MRATHLASNRRLFSVFEVILRSEEKVSFTKTRVVSIVSSHFPSQVHGPCFSDNQIALVIYYFSQVHGPCLSDNQIALVIYYSSHVHGPCLSDNKIALVIYHSSHVHGPCLSDNKIAL